MLPAMALAVYSCESDKNRTQRVQEEAAWKERNTLIRLEQKRLDASQKTGQLPNEAFASDLRVVFKWDSDRA
jgi:hypothetical protein